MMILKYQKVTCVIKNVWLWLVVNTLVMMYNQLPYDVVSNLYQSYFMVRQKKNFITKNNYIGVDIFVLTKMYSALSILVCKEFLYNRYVCKLARKGHCEDVTQLGEALASHRIINQRVLLNPNFWTGH